MKTNWILACVLVACGGDEETGSSAPASLRTQPAGYEIETRIDVSGAALLPEPAAGYLETLRLLHDDPGEALFILLDEAGVPLVDEIRSLLPDVLEDRLTDWIGDAVPESFRTGLAKVIDLADRSLVSFVIVSRLDLPDPDSRDGARAKHTITGLRFGDVEVAVPDAEGVSSTLVDARFSAGDDDHTAHLELGDHSFGVAYGERVFDALEASTPGGLRATLGELIDCPAIAADVADRCFLFVCVGHERQLAELCERGLDEAVAAVRAKLASLRIDAIHFERGAGELADTTGDSIVDGIAGTWTAEVNLGMGLRPVAASFHGSSR